ncbi:putative 2-dehydropantoate 2-reductase [Paramyrothecium foliicola]|nr:putative 2-dehydropantoate 2-reductase [Paramyrothecium foliicola]
MIAKAAQTRVHVLGLGSIGTFAAHSLAEVPAPLTPSITLLLHRASLVDEFFKRGSKVRLETREGKIVDHHGNYHLEVLDKEAWHRVCPTTARKEAKCDDIIDHLIISVKGPQTAGALRSLKHRLDASSYILFLQNGSGIIETANEQVFTDEATRPNYITGVTSHGVTLNAPFDVTHTGFATASLGPVPRTESDPATADTSYLLEALPLVPRFNGTSYSFLEIFQIQLEKLTVNAFCNPLCALNDAQNKFLFTIPETRHELLKEISQVVCALPELREVSGVKERFSVERLEATVNDIIQRTMETTCSMVVDLRRGQKTEIQYINGYWCRRGREVGVPTPLNDSLVRQILEKQGDSILAEENK